MMASSSIYSSSFFFFFAFLVFSASAFSAAGFKFSGEKRVVRRTAATSNTTHLHMYLHDKLTAPNATAVRVVSGPGNDTAAINFGDLLVIDEPLTEGPAADSPLVARAQGFYVRSSQEGLVLQISASVVFAAGAGEYAGSTLVVAGSDPLLTAAPEREYAVVGGSGRFRGARGYVLEKTVVMDPATGDGVFELDVYVDT